MFARAANYIDKLVSYPSKVVSAMSMVGIIFVMLLVVADVIRGWLFHSFFWGAGDLEMLAFCIIVWGPMALGALKKSHIALTFVLDKLPRLPRLGADLIIALVVSGVLGMFTWRLAAHGMRMGETLVRTGVLKIPFEPFVYFAAFCCALMALVYLARVLEAVGKIRKEPESVGDIQKQPETMEKIAKMKGSAA
jgi:TRAP-type C4-dicarboxylate transport system permease small subunit